MYFMIVCMYWKIVFLMCRWLNREIFLDKIEGLASKALEALIGTMEDAPSLPKDYGLGKYLDMIKAEARKFMFQVLRSRDSKGDLKSTKDVAEPKEKKTSDLGKAAQRIVFRYVTFSNLSLLQKNTFALCL